MKPYPASSLQLPAKRADHSAAEDGALVWDRATSKVQVSSGGAFVDVDSVAAAYAYGVLASDYTLTSSVAAQKLFNWSANGALDLATGVYLFDVGLYLTGMSGTSGNAQFRIRGAGTATVARILQHATSTDDTDPTTPTTASFALSDTQTCNLAMAATDTGLASRVSGSFDVTAAGTIIPTILLANAAAAVVKTGSWFRCLRIGDTGAATAGSWS